MKIRVIALALAALLLLGVSALAEGSMTVQGVGTVLVDADRVGISLGVREIADDAVSAQAMVNGKIAAIVQALKDMGIGADAISTNGIGIYPNYSYDETNGLTGYTAYDNIYFTTADVNNSGTYIDAAFAAGANSLDYVEFSATDIGDAADQATILAVESAKAKARVLASAAGKQVGDILEIRDDGGTGFDAGSPYAKNESADMGAGTEVLPSKQKISAAVSITFALVD